MNLSSQTALITGATAGIGLVTARELARMGATVIGVGRNPAKSAAAAEQIRSETGNANVEYLLADLSSQAQIRQLAAQFQAKYDRLHILVNNAGGFFMKRQLTVDGLEMTFALNHLSYFLLTNLLLDTMRATAQAVPQAGSPVRIVNVSSGANFGGKINFDDLQAERRFSSWAAYSQSKLANVMFTYELARRLDGTGITANCLHPGFVGSDFAKNNGKLYAWVMTLMKPLAVTPEQGARTTIYLATSPDVAGVTGKYFDDKQRNVPSAKVSYDESQQKRLWDVSAKLVGI
jgi:NAD(P)-dependent dehydrogenase (short-subunit alcohol dehydrogenase family)